MNYIFIKKVFFLLGLVFLSNTNMQKDNISELDLIGCWADSREENDQNGDISIYRPCDFKEFPRSRFRFKMEIKKNNVCSWLHLSPTDRHHFKEGTWLFDKETNTLKIFDKDKKEAKRFIIFKTAKDILKIKIGDL